MKTLQDHIHSTARSGHIEFSVEERNEDYVRGIKTVPGCHDANFLFTVVEEINKSAWKFNPPTGGGYPLNFLVIFIAR
jgi:hypothetical protein